MIRSKASKLWVLIAFAYCALPADAHARNRACDWDQATFSFVGTPLEQALCLLRTVSIGAEVDDAPARLPESLAASIGRPVAIDRSSFREWLRNQGIDESAIGGALDAPLSSTEAEAEAEADPSRRARYFVIHDTSNIVCERGDFPANADAPDAPWNRPEAWRDHPQAHLFITRDGASYAPQGRTFATPWRAVKFEMRLGVPSRGLFLHIENVQLRRPQVADDAPPQKTDGGCVNDRIAQSPGFTQPQLRRLAIVYAAASVRAGEWMIPAYHAVLDAGFPGGHDDPQNFDLRAWAAEVCAIRNALGDRCEMP
jgi:hypothetical protein